MHLTSRLRQTPQDHRSAGALLGPNHPLVRVVNRRRTLLEQSLVVAALLTASVAAVADGVSGALPFVAAAAVVQAALACGAAILSLSKRDEVLELIMQGHGDLPLDAVKRERRRLLDRRHRQRLAPSLDAMRSEAEHPIQTPCRAPPPFNVLVIKAVAPELATIAALLRTEDPRLPGVAAVDRMLVDGTSPLYGRDTDRLRADLHRIRHLLGGRAC